MSLNSRLLGLGFLASLVAAVPSWGQTLTMSCSPSANAGANASCAMSLQLGATVVNNLGFGVLVTAQGAAPAVADSSLTYSDTTAGVIAPSGTGIAIAYNGKNFTGNVSLGSVIIPLPSNAAGGQTYVATITKITASLTNNTVVTVNAAGTPATITVSTGLSFSSPAAGALSPGATVGAAYSQTFVASGGATPYAWTATGLPAGLSINATTGVVSGTPSAAGTASSIVITATDSETPKVSVNRTFSLVVSPAITGVTPTTLPSGTVATAYSSGNISVTGGLAPYTFSTTFSLATYGLTLAAGPGTTTSITGTPTTAGANLQIPLKVTDSNGAIGNATLTLTLNGPLSLAPASGTSLAVATQSFVYNAAVTPGGGTPPYHFASGGVLPAGLSVSTTTGAISGTPTAAGTFSNVQVTVTDSASGSVTNTYTIVVNPTLTLTSPGTIPNGTVGATYPNTTGFSAGGGSGTYTWSITGLPGVTVNTTPPGTTASLGGTPTTAAASNTVVVTVTDANSPTVSVSKTYNNVVVSPGVSITTPAAGALQTGTIGRVYNGSGLNISTTGGTTPFTWSVSAGSLPPGLTLAGSGTGGVTGLISGTPTGSITTPVTSTFTAQVVDNVGSTNTRQYTITVYAAPAVSGPGTLPTATVALAYTTGPTNPFTVTGGAPTIAWSATGLPSGMTINAATGIISGTPAAGAQTGSPYTVVVKVTDGDGATATANTTLAVNPAIVVTPATLPVAIPSVAYSQKLTATGGSGSGYTFSATGLPTGLSINAGGTISGTPAASASGNSPFHVTISVTDSLPATATFAYTLAVAPPLSVSGPATLPAGTVNVAYSPTIVTATGGTAPYSWSATGLPPGLTINSSSGQVSGTPTALAGSPYAVVVTVTDANTTKATMNYSIAVGALPLQIITGLLPTGVVNAPYPFTSIQAQGGVGTYKWTITGLPAGLSTDGNGNIAGTPTTTTGSPFSVVVTVSDTTQTSISRTYQLVVSGTLTIATPTTLPAAALNTVYAPVTVIAGGGLAPYTWSATGLPTGMSIAVATGIISGTPTVSTGSPYAVVVTVTDSTGKTATMNYTLAVNAPLTITGPASLPNGTVGVAYTSTTVTASGGSGTYTWSAASLPAGLSIGASTGAITGTPTAAGAPTVTVTVTDSNSATATKNYTLTVNPGNSSVPTLASASASTQGQSVIGPNTWVSIYGSNFAAAGFTDDWSKSIKSSSDGATLPTTLDGVSVSIGGQQAYIAYLSASQINVLTPNIGLGPLQVTVTNSAGTSNAITINSQQTVTGIFVWPTGCASNCQPVATHADYTDAVANGTFVGVTTVPAAPGETITVWGSGFGTTTPAIPYGKSVPATPTFTTTNNVTATLNSAPITVYQNLAFLTSGNAGLYQVGITVPAGLANGSYPLVITINGVPTPTLMLTVAAATKP